MNDNSLIWSSILDRIKNELDTLAYSTWFSDTNLYELKNGIAKIIVPYDIFRSHISTNYNDVIKKCFKEQLDENVEIEYLTQDEIEEENDIKDIDNTVDNSIYDDNNDYDFESNLNKKYTFDNFVVGNSNKFAHAAAVAVAQNPGSMYNPLFIYGNSGLGKTHLMHAIGNYIVKNSNKKVLYIDSETFSNEFINITRKTESKSDFDNIAFFKKKYRGVDVLIVDDIQFLEKRVESQKEFFHTFTNLYEDQKQIIVSSDRSPNDLKILEDRLRTRFNWGLPVNIYPPDFELKVAILKRIIKAEAITQEIPENVIEYIAANAGTDIRSLIGTLNRLLAYSMTMGKDIDLELALDALKEYLNSGYSEKNDISKVQKIVADYFKISIEDLKSKKRSANIAFPRQIAMYLCRKHTEESLEKIGMEFGGKDHSTVIYAYDRIKSDILKDKNLAEAIEKLEKDLLT